MNLLDVFLYKNIQDVLNWTQDRYKLEFCSLNKTAVSQHIAFIFCICSMCFLLILTWGQGLLELLSLLLVCDDQGVQVPAAAHLELDIVLVLLDLYG